MELTLAQKQAIAIAKAKKAAALAQPQGQPSVDMASDVAKSFGSGLVSGGVAAATAPMELGKLAGQGVTYGIDRLSGMTPEQASAQQAKVQQTLEANTFIPSPFELIQRGYEAVKPYVSYTPQTVAGEYARTVGEFAPAVVSPGSALRKTAAVVAPAVVSETAGQATRGTSAEPVARLVGGLAGARLASPRATAIKETAKLSPSQQTIVRQKEKLYGEFDKANLQYDRPDIKGRMRKAISDIRVNNLDTEGKVAVQALDRIRTAPLDRLNPQFLDAQRKSLGDALAAAAAKGDKEKLKAVTMAREAIDDAIANAKVNPATLTGLSPAEASAKLKQARELAQREFKVKDLDMMVDVGKWYSSGDISGIRNQLQNLGKSLAKKKNLGWSDTEIDALYRAAKGDFTTNFFNILSKAGFQFGKGAGQAAVIPAGLSFYGVTNPLAFGAVVAGTASRPIAKALTKSEFADLKKVILAGRKGQAAGISAAERKNAEALMRKLIISGQAAALTGE